MQYTHFTLNTRHTHGTLLCTNHLFRIQLFRLFASVLRLEKHTTDAPIWSTLALRIEQGLGCPSFLLSAGWHLLLRLQWRLQRRLLRRLRWRLLC